MDQVSGFPERGIFSQLSASNSSILPQGADSISQPRVAKKITKGRHLPAARNLPLPFIEVAT
jgi:hypothetical protein